MKFAKFASHPKILQGVDMFRTGYLISQSSDAAFY
jgi:hypothetical protein